MKTSLQKKFLIAVGISAGLLASLNLFAQEVAVSNPEQHYIIKSQADYLETVKSINELAAKLYDAHQKYPQLTYSHVFDSNGALMGFTVSGIPQSIVADEISATLMQLEILGNAVHTMDYAYMPESKNDKLTSRISKKKAMKSMTQEPSEGGTMQANGSIPRELSASLR